MAKLIDYRFWDGNLDEAVVQFDCGNVEINDYFKEKLLSGNPVTERIILVADNKDIFGFVSCSLSQMSTTFFEENNYAVLLVDAIGIDTHHQGVGYGTQLLLTAYQLALTVNEVVPLGGLFLVALAEAFEFYEKFDLTNLNAPPEMLPFQQEFQMVISINQIASLGLTPFGDPINLR